MFSGIVEAVAEVASKTEDHLTLKRPAAFTDVAIGSSIAVAGVCLSVTGFDPEIICFDVVEETWKKSKLGDVEVGDRVNLERSLRADQRIDGHVVQGHVEGVGTVVEKRENAELVIAMPKELNTFIVQKGSIAVDGVSLTVASFAGNQVTVALVPHTLERTTLGTLKEGDKVNVETDILGRYVYAFSHEEATHQE